MICNPCKKGKHEDCPSKLAAAGDTKTMGLSPECVAIQLSGLCPCQHKVAKLAAVETEPEKVAVG